MQLGKPYPLGATWNGTGTNFAVYSEHATSIWLCLFDETGRVEEARLPVTARTGYVWHGYLPEIRPGKRYGFRAGGDYLPDFGLWFNASKLLIDPYARALDGVINWAGPLHGYLRTGLNEGLLLDARDDAPFVPKSVVMDNSFDWEGDVRPEIPWSDTVIYETHLKGLTKLHPDVPEEQRGTYAALAHPAVIAHLKGIGVSAVELLPIHARGDDEFLARRGQTNYWGYKTIGFFAPEPRYSRSTDPESGVREFKETVKSLHRAGLEVLLDVVYNHSAEGNHLGPTFLFRGLDNRTYYRLMPGHMARNEDFTGTGNTLNIAHSQVLQLVTDSMRYWVEEMHVDGFRFDLAPVLGRDPDSFSAGAAFFDTVHQDPVLSRVKLIAEPWDLGPNGYQLGNFPLGWSEWNDRFRDAARGFWLTKSIGLSEFASRLTGSADLYDRRGRGASASINFVTAHDGFTLRDLVSYKDKHNQPNGERNGDGSDHNLSANHGVEGPTDEPAILALRLRQQKNLLVTLFLSAGVPVMLGGDELDRTQRGNNNAYSQDNETSWVDWAETFNSTELTSLVKTLTGIRKSYPMIRGDSFPGRVPPSRGDKSAITWFRLDGQVMTTADWSGSNQRCLSLRLSADASGKPGPGLQELLLLFNSSEMAVTFTVPPTRRAAGMWSYLIDTGSGELLPNRPSECAPTAVLTSSSIVVMGCGRPE